MVAPGAVGGDDGVSGCVDDSETKGAVGSVIRDGGADAFGKALPPKRLPVSCPYRDSPGDAAAAFGTAAPAAGVATPAVNAEAAAGDPAQASLARLSAKRVPGTDTSDCATTAGVGCAAVEDAAGSVA